MTQGKKEEIQESMIRSALHFWNIKNVENLDPLVRLLIEVLSEQLYVLSGEMYDMENRVIQRLSEVLLPESISKAKPSHAIAYIAPLWNGVKTELEMRFLVKNPFANNDFRQEYSFFPIANIPLYQANIKKIIHPQGIVQIDELLNKKELYTSPLFSDKKIWIGLSLDEDVKDLEHLSFFFNFPNIIKKDDYLNLLQYTQWECNGKILKVRNRLYVEEHIEKSNLVEYFFDSQEFNHRVNREILEHYSPHYLTIDQSFPIQNEEKQLAPYSLTKNPILTNEEAVAVCDQKLLWIGVSFPEQFSYQILSEIEIAINAIPIANKELKEITHNNERELGIIPLILDKKESFLGIVSVTDEKNQSYTRTHGFKSETIQRTYALRQGGTESFDNRSTKDFLAKLENILEDEGNRVFLQKEYKDIKEMVKETIKRIQLMGRTLQNEGDYEALHYVFLDNSPENLFFIKYWTTLGELANGIRIHTPLSATKVGAHSYVKQAILLTPSSGGLSIPTERERIAQFKYLLNGRGRIVTNYDIKTFLLAEYPNTISDVYIEHGISKGETSLQGLVRTIDVHLKTFSIIDEKEVLIENIYKKLVHISPMTFQYRIFIDEN
ncbi:hypothetical protein [Capnocytophaga sputigena]|uniref:hypothetical protein n=1 Tax=Capnocytophaga sputigena TaxID=1019 RepID=UPI00288AE41F|nr:hypothetical protein [Capnocytophaga sputigena]